MTLDVLTPEDAVLWPYLPDWSSSFNVKRSFATDIFDSRDNTEQRRAQRVDPRFSIEYRTKVSDTDSREASRWLRAYQNRPAIVPDFARWARLTGSSSASDTTLTITPMPAWVGEDQRLLLCGASGLLEDVLVDSVAGDTITLADPLVNGWASGSVLRPTFRGLLDGKVRAGRINNAAAEITTRLDAYPGGEPPRETGTAWATLGSREVFTLQPDFASNPSIDYIWPVEGVDFSRGRTAQFRPIETPQNASEEDFALGTAETAEVEQFFDRHKGRRNAFYMPTGDSDAVFVSSAASTVTVVGVDLAAQAFTGFDFATYEYGVSVCLTDGTDLYRRISGIAVSGGNSVITVTSPWGVSLTTGNVARISLMPLVRFGSDEMTTSWRTPLSSRIRLSFQSVRV